MIHPKVPFKKGSKTALFQWLPCPPQMTGSRCEKWESGDNMPRRLPSKMKILPPSKNEEQNSFLIPWPNCDHCSGLVPWPNPVVPASKTLPTLVLFDPLDTEFLFDFLWLDSREGQLKYTVKSKCFYYFSYMSEIRFYSQPWKHFAYSIIEG